MKIRLPAVQRSPFNEKMVNSAASMARSSSASSKISTGDLPPSSIEYFFRPAVSMILRPVSVPPVKEIARTSGCCTKALPAVAPKPCTTLNTPSGIPASKAKRPNSLAVSGEISDIFNTAVLPKAKQGAVFQVAVINGTFQGETKPQTPTG